MQRRKFKRAFGWLCTLVLMLSGCFPNRKFAFQEPKSASYYRDFATQIEYPNVSSNLSVEAAETTAPLTTDNPADIPAWEMTLDEAVQTALQRSDVLRNLGVSVVTAPNATRTRFDPAITETNPFGGVEAALSDFDATINSSLLWEKRDRPQNFGKNPLFPSLFDQNRATYLSQLAKRTATGATFAVRNNVFYDNNNNPARLFRSDYAGWFEAEWRQPLLQGSGIEYNRIAGPNSGIGQYNGVLIARVNTDISLAEFELGVITFVNDVETAYWNLFFAYRNLQSQVSGRNNVLLTWQLVKEKQRIGARGGEADAEAQARSQYYQLEAFVKESLSGPNGLYAAEQRLRYLLGLPAADGRLIKPVQSPMEGQVIYDWSSALGDALTRRAEIRRQKWAVKRSELQLVAARLNRRPRLDMLSQYRFYGMGNHLIGSRDTTEKLDNMYQTILSGDFQEWQSGVELSYPVGMRAASNAISNAQWTLTREQTLLKEQELKVSHDLSNASREIDRTYQMLQTNYNRQDADRLQVEVLRDRYQAGLSNIFFLLQAQQEYAISTSSYFKSLADYQLALRDFHREKGTLLNYNQIALSESDWAAPAYRDAYLRGQYFTPVLNSNGVGRPGTLSAGAFDPAEERPAIIGDESARVQPPGISPQSATSPGASPATDKPEIVLPNPIRQEP